MMPTTPKTLAEWRLNWTEDEIAWRTGWAMERDERRLERERARVERRKRDRQFFGRAAWGVPAEKRRAETDAERIAELGLPLLRSEAELADWLGIALTRLRWLTHNKPVETHWHYVRYEVAKRSGGTRVILAPKTELKAIQRRLYCDLLAKLPVHEAAHGFASGHSIVTNAQPHTGKQIVLNLDLKDFFPTIGFRRVRGVFMGMGYSLPVASTLALLCTEYDRKPVQRGGKTVYVSVNERGLVQGAPTSPALANLIARRLDARLSGMAARLGVTYTRYADDLTFSGDHDTAILTAHRRAHHLIVEEGFKIHPDKTRLYRPSSRQVVTGIVVNVETNTPRDLRRKVRAILHQAEQTGLNAQNREGWENFRAYLRGLIGYIHEANPNHARALREALEKAKD